jgi:hypothetical protein
MKRRLFASLEKQTRDKAAPVQEKDLALVKGGSGYIIAYDENPPDPPPPGSGT